MICYNTHMNNKPKQFAVLRRWADNPTNFQVWEYCETVEEAQELIRTLPKPKNKEYQWEVGAYF